MRHWVVVERAPESGNGVWARTRTRLGALVVLDRILSSRYHGGYYKLPAGGLVVRREGAL